MKTEEIMAEAEKIENLDERYTFILSKINKDFQFNQTIEEFKADAKSRAIARQQHIEREARIRQKPLQTWE